MHRLNLGNTAWSVISITAVALVFALVALWALADASERRARVELENTLESANEALQVWADQQARVAAFWAGSDTVREAAEALLATDPIRPLLLRDPTQAHLREDLLPIMESLDLEGYFIVSPNLVNLASSRDANVGVRSLLHRQTSFFESLANGVPTVSAPVRSDLQFGDDFRSDLNAMFAGAPILDESGTPIAWFLFRLDPEAGFSRILDTARWASSGETLAFDDSGRLLNTSRFEEEVWRLGLVPDGQSTAAFLDLRDPGERLTAGSGLQDRSWPLTVAAQSAIAIGRGSNMDGYRDYRGETVVGAWLWNDELNLGLVAEADKSEAYELRDQISMLLIGLAALGLVGAIVAAVSITRSQRRLQELNESLEETVFVRTAELSRRTNELQKTRDAMPLALFVLHEDDYIETANQAASEMLGYSHEEFIGMAPSAMVPDELMEEYRDFEERVLAGETIRTDPERGLFQLVLKDGSHLPVDFGARTIELSGQLKTLWFIVDMSNQDRLLRRLNYQSALLLEANAELDTVVSKAAHDLKAPLRKISMFSDILENDSELRLSERNKDRLPQIGSNAHILLDMIDGLLEYARSGRTTGTVTTFGVQDAVQAAWDLSGSEAFSFSIDESPVEVTTPRAPFDLIVRNLLSNAVKHHDTGAGSVSVGIETLERFVKVSVTDDGPGIPLDAHERIFVRGESTADDRSSGFGLAMVKDTVEGFGGTITVHSEGRGTTFAFTWPIVWEPVT